MVPRRPLQRTVPYRGLTERACEDRRRAAPTLPPPRPDCGGPRDQRFLRLARSAGGASRQSLGRAARLAPVVARARARPRRGNRARPGGTLARALRARAAPGLRPG